jgi:tetratricopeptide (TPR) repeat protein
VSKKNTGELSLHEIRYVDNAIPKVFDVIRISVSEATPKSYQPENVLIRNQKWVKIGTFPKERLDSLCDTPDTLWWNGKDYNNKIPVKYFETNRLGSSLLLVQVSSLVLERDIKRKLRVQFDYENVQYDLPVTDCTMEEEYLRKDCGLYPINYKPIFVCVSLGEPYKGCCYKLVSAIIFDTFDTEEEEEEEGIETYKQEVEKNPDDADAHNNLGIAYDDLGKYEEAIESYKQAIRINPDDADAHYNLGVAYLQLNDRSSALKQHKILKKLDTEKANILFNYIYK